MKSLIVGATLLTPLLASAQTLRGVLTDATFDPATGAYSVSDRSGGWRLGGSLGGPATNVRTSTGKDAGGPFHSLTFDWTADGPLRGTIRLYDESAAVFFRLEYLAGRTLPVAFPNFTTVPKDLRGFSYEDRAFSPGVFRLADTSTPWLLFNDRAQAMVLSPASQFLVAKMVGDGKASLGVSLNKRLTSVPKSLKQDSLLVFGRGINAAWEAWGGALRGLYGRTSAAAIADPIVRNYGYWTDNGASYYYNYDPAKGYAGTMLALKDHYRDAGLPMGYLQLDSWWYRKLPNGFGNHPSNAHKNPALPAGEWNRYGGTLEYRASPDLFPDGLTAFQKDLGLPFIVHGRWIDKESPLRDRFKISGIAPVDPKYWTDTTDYLAASGVRSYEQDWLDHIYDNSPELASTVGLADVFADSMARSTAAKGMTMQYCMAPPRFVLQGVKYPNLTTVRTSDDRFEPNKWASFILGASLVRAVGALPWSDVFMSGETGNAIVSTLSAGPVGTGDAIGKEDKANILKIARPDGLIVKPDAPLMAADATYLDLDKPFVATTTTDHGDLRTRYLFAFPRKKDQRSATLTLGSLGARTKYYVVSLLTGEGAYVGPNDDLTMTIGEAGFDYRMAAPVTATGVALLGDWGKFVPTGKVRLASVEDRADGLRVRVGFAKGEGPVTLEGVSEREPKVAATRGTARIVRHDSATGRFAVEVQPEKESADIILDGRP